jgi:hypothetical protein
MTKKRRLYESIANLMVSFASADYALCAFKLLHYRDDRDDLARARCKRADERRIARRAPRESKKEGGKLNLYASLSGNSIDVILPTFQKRFAGVTVDHTDATADKLIARIVAEGSPTRSAPGCRTSRR